jgi:putative Mn2+ efflux pump MntP
VALSIDRSSYGSSFTSVRVAHARSARITFSFTISMSMTGKMAQSMNARSAAFA